MAKRSASCLLLTFCLLALAVPSWGQESAVKGNLAGIVYDSSGAVVPGAKVTVTGSTGSKTVDSDENGSFEFPLLIPGMYSVKVTKDGFKTWETKAVEVYTNRTSNIRATLEPGAVSSIVEVTVPTVTIDIASTGIGANLNDSFYQTIPVSRGIAGLFYLSPGVASGGGTGASNPSISGGSGLENLYVADGVNITDASFGGLGTFSRVYGSLGTGINLSFVKEVQVKTGGYEPQYGKATGGIVQIVTKSGGSEYHGAISGYFAPRKFEATRLHPDDFGRTNLAGKALHAANFDISGEFGGYVPGAKEKLFFFSSINPTWERTEVLSPPNSGLFASGTRDRETTTINYAFKLTFRASASHQLEASIFGDPADTNSTTWRTLNIDNTTANSSLDYGSRNLAFRWNGSLTPTWLANASFTWSSNHFTETPEFNLHNIVDRTQAAGLPGQRGIFTAVGIGFLEPTQGDTYGFNIDTTKTYKAWGENTFTIGYRFEKPNFDGQRLRSGPTYNFPATNSAGTSTVALGADPSFIGQSTTASFSLRLGAASCTLCPLMTIPGFATPQPVFLRADRNDINSPFTFDTNGTIHSAYVLNSWNPNKYVTLNLGMRWEQQRLQGGTIGYTFDGFWSPRLGLIVDPWGDRKTKIYTNFGRYGYSIPLDLALRSLTNELSALLTRWAPDFTVNALGQRIAVINQFGTVTPVLDAAHLINGAPGGSGGAIFSLGQSTTGIARGTKMQYVDEFVIGAEREFPGGVVVSGRYIDRRMKRIVEDGAGVSPEGANAGLTQIYLIGNLGATTDFFTNERGIRFASGSPVPAACGGTPFVLDPVEDSLLNFLGAVCFPGFTTTQGGATTLFGGEDIPDGVPDGFPRPIREYQAVEIEVNKAFSNNWQMRANWRIGRLWGNFEGAFRNDNGQSDPSISSLFDFVGGQFGLLGAQFEPGYLNTDRRHVVNIYTSYVVHKSVLKGMGLGLGVRVESGTPINDFLAHPAYLNSGEIPIGGRGALGRLPTTGQVDIHVDYPFNVTERSKIRLGIDMFNIANARRQRNIDQNRDASFGTANVDFLKPVGIFTGFQRPFYARMFAKFEF